MGDVDGDGVRDRVAIHYAANARSSCGFLLVVETRRKMFAARLSAEGKAQDLPVRQWPFAEPYVGLIVHLTASGSQIVVARSHGAAVVNVSLHGLVDDRSCSCGSLPSGTRTSSRSTEPSARAIPTRAASGAARSSSWREAPPARPGSAGASTAPSTGSHMIVSRSVASGTRSCRRATPGRSPDVGASISRRSQAAPSREAVAYDKPLGSTSQSKSTGSGSEVASVTAFPPSSCYGQKTAAGAGVLSP